MDGGRRKTRYLVNEFDMPDPDQRLKDRLDAFFRAYNAGGDEPVGDERPDGAARGSAYAEEQPFEAGMLDVVKTADSGDATDVLRSIDERRAKGILTDVEALTLKQTTCRVADDPEGELDATVELDEITGEISHSSRANALYRLGRIDEMAELCKAWETSRILRDDFYLCRARIMRAKGDLDSARRHAVAIFTLEPYKHRAVELLGDVLADAGDLRGAVLQYNRALKGDYNEAQFHVKKAEALMRMGRPDSAALACRRGLAVRPGDKRLLAMLEVAGGASEPRRGGV